MIELEKDKYQTIPAIITDNAGRNIWSFESSMAMWARAIEEHSMCDIHDLSIHRDKVTGRITKIKAKITFR